LNNWLPTLQFVCRPNDEEIFVDTAMGNRFREYFVVQLLYLVPRYIPKRAF